MSDRIGRKLPCVACGRIFSPRYDAQGLYCGSRCVWAVNSVRANTVRRVQTGLSSGAISPREAAAQMASLPAARDLQDAPTGEPITETARRRELAARRRMLRGYERLVALGRAGATL